MNCPNDIADILLEILENGTAYARAAGWSGDAERAVVEADHIHNLPYLIRNFSLSSLYYYWNVQRKHFIGKTDDRMLAMYQPLWERLEPFVPAERPPREGSKSMAQIAHEFAAEHRKGE